MIMKEMTINEAKELFFLSNCSSFVMAREYLAEYKSYIQLKVPKETEQEWREEKLIDYYLAVKNDLLKESIWIIIDRMSELAFSIKSLQSLERVFETINGVLNNLTDLERVIISETINGRKHTSVRSGLIYLAFDIGQISLAKQFSLLSIELSTFSTNDFDLLKRANNSKQLCEQIINDLFL